MVRLASIVLFASLATACGMATASPAPPPQARTAVPAEASATPAEPGHGLPAKAEVLSVPAELSERLRREVVAPHRNQVERLTALVHFIFDPDKLDLRYDNQRTRTISETWREQRGNCLSFTLLFVALAREAGFDARVQEIGQVLAWYERGDSAYAAGHVNAGVRLNGIWRTIDLDRSIIVAGSLPKPISDTRSLAHFYNNVASEWMERNNAVLAHEALRLALDLQPGFVPALNNLGVLYSRERNPRAADATFLAILKSEPRSVSALSNLVVLHEHLGNQDMAANYRGRLERVQSRDPFQQFILALRDENDQRYKDAIARYRTALRLLPGTARFHFGLARGYYMEGHWRKAEREMRLARDASTHDNERALYQHKLDALHRLADQGQRTASGR